MQSETDYRLHLEEAIDDNSHLDYHLSNGNAVLVRPSRYLTDATGLSVDYQVRSVPIGLCDPMMFY